MEHIVKQRIKTLLEGEPVMVMAFVEAGVALAVAFGLDLTGEQVAGIFGIVAVLTGVTARQQVWPTSKVAEQNRATWLKGYESALHGDKVAGGDV